MVKTKNLSLRGERFDLRGATLVRPFGHLFSGTAYSGDTLDFDDAVPAAKPTQC